MTNRAGKYLARLQSQETPTIEGKPVKFYRKTFPLAGVALAACGVIVLFAAAVSRGAQSDASDWKPPFFERRGTFAETLFATRANWRSWKSQQGNWEGGAWLMKPGKGSSEAVASEALSLATLDGGNALSVGWVCREDLKDGVPFKNPQSALYARVLDVRSPCALTIKVASRARVWLNGKEMQPGPRSPYGNAALFFQADVPAGKHVVQVLLFGLSGGMTTISFAPDVSKDILMRTERDYPHEVDWLIQDATEGEIRQWLCGGPTAEFANKIISKAVAGLSGEIQKRCQTLRESRATAADDAPEWLELYRQACEARRARRLAGLVASGTAIVFVENWDYNEGRCSHAETGDYVGLYSGRFRAGSSLRLFSLVGLYGEEKPLVEDGHGMIRDPSVSYDGTKILFSWRKSPSDGYHLYEYDMLLGGVRQLTDGQGVSDVEGVYLPNGDIVFSSTRCVIAVDCMGHPALNLFRCGADGARIRRLGFDQVTTDSPSVLHDGRIVFTRWEYNDRNPVYQSPLMQMNPDGTGQGGYCNNNSACPTALHHAQAIPGSRKVIAVATGHHTVQAGKLVVLDRPQGLGAGRGLQFVSPVSAFPTAGLRIDRFGQEGALYQYPYPLSEEEYLVSCAPWGHEQSWALPLYGAPHFGIYYTTKHGERELLVKKQDTACRNPRLLAGRPRPPIVPDRVDDSKSTGVVFVKDVYAGDGLTGVARGTAKRLRVVALDFKPASIGIGKMDWSDNVTPVSINGTWDVKKVLGEVDIHEDGSVLFEVPAREAIYFQVLDDRGFAIQSMRSWMSVMPGERLSCVGCHEHRQSVVANGGATPMAMSIAPQKLRPFYGPTRGFSFIQEIQPILDRRCISCHNGPRKSSYLNSGEIPRNSPAGATQAFSLSASQLVDSQTKRKWSVSYLELLGAVCGGSGRPLAQYASLNINQPLKPSDCDPLLSWLSPMGPETILPPYHTGAAKSRLLVLLREGHHDVRLSREETDKMACWIDLGVPYCGDYSEANAWTAQEVAEYEKRVQKRRDMAAIEQQNIRGYIEERQKQ